MFRQSFDDCAGIPDRDTLCQQTLQYTYHHGQRQELGDEVLDEFGGRLGQSVEQVLHFLVAEDLVGMRLNDETEMCRNDSARIDDRVAQCLRVIALPGLDPERFHAKRGVAGRNSLDRSEHPARIDSQFTFWINDGSRRPGHPPD